MRQLDELNTQNKFVTRTLDALIQLDVSRLKSLTYERIKIKSFSFVTGDGDNVAQDKGKSKSQGSKNQNFALNAFRVET